MDNRIYKIFDSLRFPLAIGVIFIHSFGKPIDISDIYLPLKIEDIFSYIRIFFSHVLPHIAVPTFFFISGYLFFVNIETFNKLKKRIKTLVVPYFLWNLIPIIFFTIILLTKYIISGFNNIDDIKNYFLSLNWRIFWDWNIWNLERTNIIGMITPSSGPINLPLWFLRDLIVMIIITPLLYVLLNKKLIPIILFSILYFLNIPLYFDGLSNTALFFFSLGSYFSINKLDLIKVISYYKLYLIPISFILLIFTTVYDGRYTFVGNILYPFYILSGMFSMFIISNYFVNIKGYKYAITKSKSSFLTILCIAFAS